MMRRTPLEDIYVSNTFNTLVAQSGLQGNGIFTIHGDSKLYVYFSHGDGNTNSIISTNL